MLTWAGWLGSAAALPSTIFFRGEEASCRCLCVRPTQLWLPSESAQGQACWSEQIRGASLQALLLPPVVLQPATAASAAQRSRAGGTRTAPCQAVPKQAASVASCPGGCGARPGAICSGSTQARGHLAAPAAVGRGSHHSPGAGPRVVAGRGCLHALVFVLGGAHLHRPGSRVGWPMLHVPKCVCVDCEWGTAQWTLLWGMPAAGRSMDHSPQTGRLCICRSRMRIQGWIGVQHGSRPPVESAASCSGVGRPSPPLAGSPGLANESMRAAMAQSSVITRPAGCHLL